MWQKKSSLLSKFSKEQSGPPGYTVYGNKNFKIILFTSTSLTPFCFSCISFFTIVYFLFSYEQRRYNYYFNFLFLSLFLYYKKTDLLIALVFSLRKQGPEFSSKFDSARGNICHSGTGLVVFSCPWSAERLSNHNGHVSRACRL